MSTERALRPWYREPWPWILMSGPAIVVGKPLPSLSAHDTPAAPRMHTSSRPSPFTSPMRSVP